MCYMKRYLIKVFLEHFAFGLTLSVSIIWMLSQGLSLTDIAVIESLALVVGIAIDIPTGYISDRFGRKFALVGASIFQACSFLLFAFSHDFWHFLIAAILLAVGFALSSGSEEAYIFENQSGDEYRKTFSNVNIVDEVATIAGLVLAPALITSSSLQTVFVVAAGFVLLTAIVGAIVLRSEGRHEMPAVSRDLTEKRQITALLRRHAPVILLLVALAMYYEAGRIFWQPQLLASGFTVAQLGYLFAAFKLASLAGAYVGRHQRFSPKSEIVTIGFLVTISFLLIATSVWWLVFVGFALYSFLENLYRIVESDYLQSIANGQKRAAFLSAASFSRQGYSAITVPAISVLAVMNVSYAFYALAALQLGAIGLYWLLQPRKTYA
jgi:MFS family permease